MYYTIEEAKAMCAQLSEKWSLTKLNIADSDKMYLSKVEDRDVDNLHNAVNLWLCLFEDCTGYNHSILKNYIQQKSIVSVILEAKRLRIDFINSNFDYTIFLPGTPWYAFRGGLRGHLPVEVVLLILGLDKRLHFVNANLAEIAYDKILATNRNFMNHKVADVKGWDFGEYHFHPLTLTRSSNIIKDRYIAPSIDFFDHTKAMVIAVVRHYVSELLPEKFELNDFTLPPRSTYEFSRKEATYLAKYLELSGCREYIQDFMDMPKDYFANVDRTVEIRKIGRLMSVPKDVGAYRTVFPEEVARQFIGYAYADAISRSLERRVYTMDYSSICKTYGIDIPDANLCKFGGIDLKCQERNQLAARIGSVTNRLATIDFSQASDTNSVLLSKKILPKNHFDLLYAIRADKMEVNGKIIPSNIMFTMGFSATFPIESVIFTAAGRAAVALSWNFAPDEDRAFFRNINRALASCFSYGDDLIVPSFAVGALEMISAHLGLIINVDKSYYDSPYRESCGKEYYNGIDISTEYFPRGTSSTRLAELIGLQHKLYQYPTTNAFIIQKCGQYRSHLTYNSIGSPYMDIWGYDEPPVYHKAPYQVCRGVIKTNWGDFPFHEVDGNTYISGIGEVTISENSYYSFVLKREVPFWIVTYAIKGKVTVGPKHKLLDRPLLRFEKIYEVVNEVDEEPYSMVTVPSVVFSKVKRSAEALDSIERLAYVMSLKEMSRRPSMNSDEYLDFMISRDSGYDPLEHPYSEGIGAIDYGQLRKSLSSTSSIKLVRKIIKK